MKASLVAVRAVSTENAAAAPAAAVAAASARAVLRRWGTGRRFLIGRHCHTAKQRSNENETAGGQSGSVGGEHGGEGAAGGAVGWGGTRAGGESLVDPRRTVLLASVTWWCSRPPPRPNARAVPSRRRDRHFCCTPPLYLY